MLPRLKTLVLLLAVICAIAPAKVFGDEVKEVTAKGTAMIMADKAQARDQAIQDGLRKAVKEAVGMFLTSETQVHNFQLVRDDILTRTQGYVQRYVIAHEGQMGDMYNVTVTAWVKTGPLKQDLIALGVLMEAKHKPRVLLCVTEVTPGEGKKYWWGGYGGLLVAENTMAEKLNEMEFTIVDRTTIPPPNMGVGASLSDSQAAAFGKHYDAEVVMVGKAVVSGGSPVGTYSGVTMRSYSCTMSVRAVRVGNGRLLASSTTTAAAVQMDLTRGVAQAMTKAASQMAKKLGDQIVATYTREVASTMMITMLVRGLSYGDYVKFRGLMTQMIRVAKRVHHRRFTQNVGYMDVEVIGNADDLATALATQGVSGFRVQVLDVQPNKMEIEAQATM